MTERTAVGRGRPRDPAIAAAVIAAARELLLDVGYSGLNFDLLARRANVSRPAIYRRWPSKAALVSDVVFPKAPPDQVGGIIDTGDIRTDLLAYANEAVRMFSEPLAVAAMPGLLADFHADRSALAAVTVSRWEPNRLAFTNRIAIGIGRGEVAPGADPITILNTIVGAVMFHMVFLQQPPGAFVESLTDLLLGSLRPR